ncbi:hypothetical protein C8R47DRAFT_1072032 [Mycena vitilis]|nr:hypothetical protein C8R47DRAFT_1072032 [Mycena vitilis]
MRSMQLEKLPVGRFPGQIRTVLDPRKLNRLRLQRSYTLITSTKRTIRSVSFTPLESPGLCAVDLLLAILSCPPAFVSTINFLYLLYPHLCALRFVIFESVRPFSERRWSGFSPSLLVQSRQSTTQCYRDLQVIVFAIVQLTRFSVTFLDLSLRHRVNRSELQCTMPWDMEPFVAGLPEADRKKLLSALCRLSARAPIEAAEAYLNLRPYKEHRGFVYAHLRPNWEVLEDAPNVPLDELDWVDVKVGQAENMENRQLDYEADCVDEPIHWAFCYQTSRPKLIERLTHLTLWEMGAKRVPYVCRGCGVRHREHFSEAMSGGLEVVAAIIEYWMRRIGEQPTRIPLDLD